MWPSPDAYFHLGRTHLLRCCRASARAASKRARVGACNHIHGGAGAFALCGGFSKQLGRKLPVPAMLPVAKKPGIGFRHEADVVEPRGPRGAMVCEKTPDAPPAIGPADQHRP